MKILIEKGMIDALISWIPNEGGPAAELVNRVLDLIAPKKPEVVQQFALTLDQPWLSSEPIAKLAGMTGACIVTLDGWPTEIFVVANAPDEFVGEEIELKRKNSVSYDAEKVLELAEAEFAKAKK